MPTFLYEGRREQTGEQVHGVREAASHTTLGQDLLSEGILLTNVQQQKQDTGGSSFFSVLGGRVTPLDRALFARYLGMMLRSGLDIKRAMLALGEQTTNKTMKAAIGAVYQDIERGQTLSDSMSAFPKVFTPLFVSFVRVGETTGRLQESLIILAEQLQKEYELKRTVRGAMMYPIVIIVALFSVGFAMMVFVLPRLAEVFKGFNVELPLTTKILLGMGEFMGQYWLLVLFALLVLAATIWILLRIKAVKEAVLNALLFIPIIGPIMKEINVAHFCRNLSSLLGSGVSFVEAVNLLGTNTTHPRYAKIIFDAEQEIRQGKPFSSFLVNFPHLFPALVLNVIKVGEETGELDKVLGETATFYESEVDQTMKNLTSIIEPVLMIVIGLAVGALAISVISPIYSLVNVIG